MALLDPSWLSRLSSLRLLGRRRAAGARGGHHRSPRRGRSLEFADHRPYSHGDDLRLLDWHLFARLDSLWIKRFQEEEDRTIQVILDCSASMQGPKLETSRRVAAALSWVALEGGDRVALVPFADEVRGYAPPRRGRAQAFGLFKVMEAVHPGGETRLLDCMSAWPRHRGAGMALLFSDFLYPEGHEAPLKRLSAQQETLVFHLVSPEEREPELDGELLLVDAETGDEMALTIDDVTLERYRQAVAQHEDAVATSCQRLGLPYVRISTEDDVETLVFRTLRQRGLLR